MDFPQDLVYTVLSFLSDDKTILARCSVVCRDWCQPSSRYLFKELRVVRRSLLPPKLSPKPLQPLQPLQPFLEFLQTTPRAANHVRMLHLGLDSDASPFRVCEYSATLMARIIACTPYLHTITTPSWLSYIDSPGSLVEESVLPTPRLKLRNLDLALTFCFNKDPTFLSRFLQFFADIEEVTFYGGQTYYLLDTGHRTHYATPSLPDPISIPGIQPLAAPSLDIGHVTSPAHLTSLVAFLGSAFDLQSVRKLSFTSSEASKARIFNTLVERTNNIDHLRVEVHQGMDPRIGMCSEIWELPAVASCQHLRSIHMDLDVTIYRYMPPYSTERGLASFMNILKAAPTSLREVVLHLKLVGSMRLKDIKRILDLDWPILDGILGRFERMESFCLLIDFRAIVDVGPPLKLHLRMRDKFSRPFVTVEIVRR